LEPELGVTFNHLSLPKLSSKQICLLHDGIAGLRYTQNQVAIAYETFKRIGIEIASIRERGDLMADADSLISLNIFRDIDTLYDSQAADLDLQAEPDCARIGDDDQYAFEQPDALPPYQIPHPCRPKPGQHYDWISSHLGMQTIDSAADANLGESTTIYRHVERTFPARFRAITTAHPAPAVPALGIGAPSNINGADAPMTGLIQVQAAPVTVIFGPHVMPEPARAVLVSDMDALSSTVDTALDSAAAPKTGPLQVQPAPVTVVFGPQ
jgi:hypothetical protein